MSIETRVRGSTPQPAGGGSGGGGSSNSAGLAGTGGLFVVTSASPLLPNSRILTAGSSVTIVTDATSIYISAITGGGSGTINAGSAGFLAYYPSAGTTIDDAPISVTTGAGLATFNFQALTTQIASANTGDFWVLNSAGLFMHYFINGTAFYTRLTHTDGGVAASSAGLAGTGPFYVLSSANNTLPNAVTYTSVATGFFNIPVQSALLYSTNSAASIDAATGFFRLLYSATTAQAGKWQWVMPQDYSGSPKLRLLFSSDSGTSVTKTVIWNADVWGFNPTSTAGFLYLDTWGAVNSQTVTLPNTYAAGNVTSSLITLTNVVSWQAGNFVKLRLTQSGGTVVGNTELLGLMIEYQRV